MWQGGGAGAATAHRLRLTAHDIIHNSWKMNVVYRDLILARVQAAVGAAKALTNITHKGLKGQLREIVIRDLFHPLLPSDVGVGTGEIISADNRHSRQQDVVIFDKRILPPIVLEQVKGVFPIESVLYAIEVKSKMTAKAIKNSHRSATELMGFSYLSGDYDEFGKPTRHQLTKVTSSVLAFGTDLKRERKNDVQRYDEIRGSNYAAIRAICIVGSGYWFRLRDETWRRWPQTYEFEEVVGFIAGVMNMYRMVAATRKEPRLGLYLTDE